MRKTVAILSAELDEYKAKMAAAAQAYADAVKEAGGLLPPQHDVPPTFEDDDWSVH